MNLNGLKPINRRVLLQKTIKADGVKEIDGHEYHTNGGVILPYYVADDTHWCEVVRVSDDCEIFTEESIGGLVLAPEFSDGFDAIEPKLGYWMAREDVLPPFVMRD